MTKKQARNEHHKALIWYYTKELVIAERPGPTYDQDYVYGVERELVELMSGIECIDSKDYLPIHESMMKEINNER